MNEPRILIAGIGNIFLGDDGFGVEVAQRLATRDLPNSVRVVDFGIRGFDLAYAMLDGYDSIVFVDATPRGGSPGDLYVIEPTRDDASGGDDAPVIDTHRMNPVNVMRFASTMGECTARLLLVGCEPTPLCEEDDILHCLSQPVQESIEPAIALIENLIDKELTRIGSGARSQPVAEQEIASARSPQGSSV